MRLIPGDGGVSVLLRFLHGLGYSAWGQRVVVRGESDRTGRREVRQRSAHASGRVQSWTKTRRTGEGRDGRRREDSTGGGATNTDTSYFPRHKGPLQGPGPIGLSANAVLPVTFVSGRRKVADHVFEKYKCPVVHSLRLRPLWNACRRPNPPADTLTNTSTARPILLVSCFASSTRPPTVSAP